MTKGKSPDLDAFAELTLHRMVPSEKGAEMISFAALAQESMPFVIVHETHGRGKLRPFLYLLLREDKKFDIVKFFAEPMRITEDGIVRFGAKRGTDTDALSLISNEQYNDEEPIDIITIEKDDPKTSGSYNSHYIKMVAKTKSSNTINHFKWRTNVQINKNKDESNLVFQRSKKYASYVKNFVISDNGDIELPILGSSIIMHSPNGKCWRITIDDEGNIKTLPVNKKR